MGRAILGALLCLIGGVWFLQGINVIKGSFMTGTVTWTIIGALCVVGGLELIRRGVRGRGGPAA
jgi:hypothetical protein